ncbi:MAG TPA: VOC family protein [Acidimicrobiales bacterium]|nr:VOC family protein [Acidimicrobiales bacterium]
MDLSLLAISLDAGDAGRLAGFWARLLDRPVDDGASADFASIGLAAAGSGAPVWMFHKVPESKVAKNRSHVDLVADDLDKAVAHALDLGARQLGTFDEGGYQWTSLADPEGNEFDIVAAP